MKRRLLLAIAVCLLASSQSRSARGDLVLAAVRDGSLNAVAMFSPTLGFINQVTTDGPILGLTSGVNNDFYVAVGNHTDHYSDSGTLLGTITASPTTVTPALSFGGDMVFAGVRDGSLNAVAMFSPTLGFINQVTTDGPILGLTSGVNNDFYVAVGNHTDHYSDSGTLLGTITASPTTVTPALSFGGGMVFAGVRDGSLNAVAMFSPTLGFINQVTTDGPVLGVTVGTSSDFYVSVGNHTDHYSDSGTLLGTITASPTTVTPALSYQVTPTAVPEPSSMARFGVMVLGVLATAGRKRIAAKRSPRRVQRGN